MQRTIRVGGEIGVQFVENPGEGNLESDLYGGGAAELAVRLLEGQLEIAAVLGLQLTSIGVSSRRGYYSQITTEGVGWVF